MKKYTFLLGAISLVSLCGAGCSSSDSPIDSETPVDDGKVAVRITTDVETKAAVVTALADGDAMNVYAKSYGQLTAADLVSGIQAVRVSGSWAITPEIRISQDQHAFIYAVYPYDVTNTNPQAIAIDLDKQQDVLYSGAYVPVSYTTNTAKLTMKHALALTTFNMVKQGYTKGNGELQGLEVYGENIYVKGTMRVDNGSITTTDLGTVSVSVSKTLTASGWSTDLPRLWAIPFSTKAQTTYLKATIDGKSYEARFPEVEVKKGYQYVFHLVLTDYGLEFIADQTTSVSLNQEDDAMGELQLYGVLVLQHRAQDFTVPAFTGDNVFGSIDWGDTQYGSYEYAASHCYSGNTDRQVVIETWNSTGFEIKDMTDITTIDISQY